MRIESQFRSGMLQFCVVNGIDAVYPLTFSVLPFYPRRRRSLCDIAILGSVLWRCRAV
jgi:hypothetical protein